MASLQKAHTFTPFLSLCIMSDATATATAIPREINLGLQKPVATPAYTRRFKSQAQTIESSAGTQATITLDTAQPGSFIDTLDSYLSFTLRLTNNTEKGYNVSFSACGAQGLIRAMRIYVQGVPIEEITEYNALVEWLHDLSGIPDHCDRSAKSRYLANTMNDDYFIYMPPKATNTNEVQRDIQIQLPIISGVLGTMADKMFPSMLVAPGNCYIQLDLATAQNALRIQEVDVKDLVVGTAGPTDDNAEGESHVPNMITTTSVAAFNSTLIDFGGASAQGGVALDASTILEDRPFDIPFTGSTTNDYDSPNHTGVLTTEERIGGGFFGPTANQPGGAGQNNGIFASTVVASYAAVPVGSTVNVAASTATTNPSTAIYLGSGVNTSANAVQASAATRKMNTALATTAVNFSIRNLEYVGKQVVVGDDVARAIIERAAAGDISIHTQSYRQYATTIPLNSWTYRTDPAYSDLDYTVQAGNPLTNLVQRVSQPTSQSLVIPAKISSANAIYHIFRNGVGMEDFQFASLRRMTVGFSDATPGSTTAQLRIGNELIPQSPIQSASEALEELLKAHHMDGFYGTCEKMGSLVVSGAQQQWPKVASLLTLRGASGNTATTEIPRDYSMDIARQLDAAYGADRVLRNDYNSQILCPNPDSVTFVYKPFTADTPDKTFFRRLPATDGAAFNFYNGGELLGRHAHYQVAYVAGPPISVAVNFEPYAETGTEYANRQAKWKMAVRRAFFGYADERSEHQIVAPEKKNFMHPLKQHTGRYSTFMLGFDLDTFSHNSETIRSGHYLGNNTVSISLTNCEFIDNSPLNQALCNSVRMDTYVLHDLRLSFQAGGIVQAFY